MKGPACEKRGQMTLSSSHGLEAPSASNTMSPRAVEPPTTLLGNVVFGEHEAHDELLASHGVVLGNQSERQSSIEPGPEPGCEWDFLAKGLFLLCFIPVNCATIMCCCCCRRPTHPTWGKTFEVAITTMRAASWMSEGKNHLTMRQIQCRISLLRLVASPPVGVVPKWLPVLPRDVGCTSKNSEKFSLSSIHIVSLLEADV